MPYAINNNIRVFYEVTGEGRPLVLLHANPCSNRMWLYQIATFSQWFRVITPDMRAYGRSDKPTTPYPFCELVDDVLAVCETENVKSGILAGTSMGSKIAFQLLAENSGIFDASVHIGGNALRGKSYDDRIKGYESVGSKVRSYRETHLTELFALDFIKTDLGKYLISMLLNDSENLSGRAIAQLFRSFDNVDLLDKISKFDKPTLILNGEFDSSLPGAQNTIKFIPKSKHVIIKNAGHLCVLEKPDLVNAAIKTFFCENDILPHIF